MPERSYFVVVSCTALDVRRAAEAGAALYAAARHVAGSDALDAVSVQVLAFEAGQLVEVLGPSGVTLEPVESDTGIRIEPSIDPVLENWVAMLLDTTARAIAEWPAWLQRLAGRGGGGVVGAVPELESDDEKSAVFEEIRRVAQDAVDRGVRALTLPEWQSQVHDITTDRTPADALVWRPEVGQWCTVLGTDPLVGGRVGEIVMYVGADTWRVRISRGAHGSTDHELETDRLGPPPEGFR